MSGRYHAPPSLGSKARDSAEFCQKLTVWKPKLIALMFAGLGKELVEYSGDAKLLICDSDPAIRAWWRCANAGRIAEAGAYAHALWDDTISGCDGNVSAAWSALRKAEAGFSQDVVTAAAHAICMFAGARLAIRRRNSKGFFNMPMPPNPTAEFLHERIPSAEKLAETDTFSKGRVLAIASEFERAFDWLATAASAWVEPEEIGLSEDPPYGFRAAECFDGNWSNARRDILIERTREAQDRGSKVFAWCGIFDLDAWAPPNASTLVLDPRDDSWQEYGETTCMPDWPRRYAGLEWKYRRAGTNMKMPHLKKDGTMEPARKASGGYLGFSTR